MRNEGGLSAGLWKVSREQDMTEQTDKNQTTGYDITLLLDFGPLLMIYPIF